MKNLVMKMYYGLETMLMILYLALLVLVGERTIYFLSGMIFSGKNIVIATIIVVIGIMLVPFMIFLDGKFSDKEQMLTTKWKEKKKKSYERYLLISKVVYALAGLGLLAILYETNGGMLMLYHACLFIAIFTFVTAIIRGIVLWNYCNTN